MGASVGEERGTDAVARPLPESIGGRHTFAWEQVLAYLARRSDGDSCAVVGKREVAESLDMSPNTAARSLTILRRRGLIESAARHGANGSQLVNSYRLTREGAELLARLALLAYDQVR